MEKIYKNYEFNIINVKDKEKYPERITIRITTNTMKRLKWIAEDNNMKVGAVARSFIQKEIENYKDF